MKGLKILRDKHPVEAQLRNEFPRLCILLKSASYPEKPFSDGDSMLRCFLIRKIELTMPNKRDRGQRIRISADEHWRAFGKFTALAV